MMNKHQVQYAHSHVAEHFCPEGSTGQASKLFYIHDGWWPKVQGLMACPQWSKIWTYLLQCPRLSEEGVSKCQAEVGRGIVIRRRWMEEPGWGLQVQITLKTTTSRLENEGRCGGMWGKLAWIWALIQEVSIYIIAVSWFSIYSKYLARVSFFRRLIFLFSDCILACWNSTMSQHFPRHFFSS